MRGGERKGQGSPRWWNEIRKAGRRRAPSVLRKGRGGGGKKIPHGKVQTLKKKRGGGSRTGSLSR